jgi:N utilization substance protein B
MGKEPPQGGHKIMAMTRREARELAFTLLFEMTFDAEKEPMLLYLQEMEARGFEENEYVKTVVVGSHEKREEIDALIEKYSNGWKVKRISRVSLAIMRLCIFEMLYMPYIPYNVSINEAVELCKTYNDEKAPAFVNGILNTVASKEGLKG